MGVEIAINAFLTGQDIIDRLCEEDKKKYTQCVFVKAEINNFGDEVTLYCRLFTDNQTDMTESHTRRIKLKI